MAKITLCSHGHGMSDVVFTIELYEKHEIEAFVRLVKHGANASGLVTPSIVISGKQEQELSDRRGWDFNVNAV